MLRLLLILAFLAVPITASAAARVAFVVGNSSYENAPPLSNPTNDARLVSRALKDLGFEVESHSNLSRWKIAAELSDFLDKTKDAELTLFYFAGHGMQFEGRNYLLGTDAQLQSELDIQAEALELGQITRLLRRNSRAALIFIDACRDNPVATDFYRRTLPATRSTGLQGLAEPTERFDGAMVTFSSSPGQVAYDGRGAYSPFAESLAKHLPSPNTEILTLMKRVIGDVRTATGGRQVPMVSNDLSREIYLLEKAALPVAPAPEPAPKKTISELDRVFKAALEAGTERGWALFLNRFPQSIHQRAALAGWEAAILADSDDGDAAARALEGRLSIDSTTIRATQLALNQQGFDAGTADGVLGRRSRSALAAFQKDRGLPESGALTIATAQALGVTLRPRGFVPIPTYSSRISKYYRPSTIAALELDPRIHKASIAMNGRKFVYGYNDGRLYIVMLMSRPWQPFETARKIARDAGGHLAVIGSRRENDFIYDLAKHDRKFWHDCNGVNCTDVFGPSFGLYQIEGAREPAGGWRWVTGEQMTFTNWNDNSPANYNTDENDYVAAFFKWRGQIASSFHGKTWHDFSRVPTSIVIEIE
jgi:uncharacterized caspase-like protein